MGLVNMLDISDRSQFSIDWEITPAATFTMFESWGGVNGERIRNNDEKFYYFYVDAWESPAALYLMERGVRHAKILARVDAPQELIDRCVAEGGRSTTLDKSYAINGAVRDWLIKTVIDSGDSSLVTPIKHEESAEKMETSGLLAPGTVPVGLEVVKLRSEADFFSEEQVAELTRKGGYFDTKRNPDGILTNYLVDNGDGRTVTDLATGLMWDRYGCDIANIKRVRNHVEEMNRTEYGGHSDWRMPTIDEAMSLMEPHANSKGLHLHPCFSQEQPFIFSADQRRPGGYWFVDYKQGAAFWASGTIPGGFGRACRSI
jgi:hypothetical protein